jgi:hypothetical protein
LGCLYRPRCTPQCHRFVAGRPASAGRGCRHGKMPAPCCHSEPPQSVVQLGVVLQAEDRCDPISVSLSIRLAPLTPHICSIALPANNAQVPINVAAYVYSRLCCIWHNSDFSLVLANINSAALDTLLPHATTGQCCKSFRSTQQRTGDSLPVTRMSDFQMMSAEVTIIPVECSQCTTAN